MYPAAPHSEPRQRPEITEAYRSKIGEGATVIPGLRWERWRIKEIRGWSLKFRRLRQNGGPGVRTLHYQGIAKQGGRCAEYRIVEVVPFPPVNPQVKASLTVEPAGVSPCR